MRALVGLRCTFLASLLAAGRGAGLPDTQLGTFGPEYLGGAEYFFEDPGEETGTPLLFHRNEENMTCSNAPKDVPFLKQIRGVNVGGWLVLEPWITPSLFYQFLGADERYHEKTPAHVGMDTFTFCKVLGPVEGQKQLQRHWNTWVTERDIRELYMANIDSLRVPVGDWMWRPYGPYIGCADGALEHLDRLLALAAKYQMKVLLDLHALEGSQNGLDNSGLTWNVDWSKKGEAANPELEWVGEGGALDTGTEFSHWSVRSAEWMGKYNMKKNVYTELYWYRLDETLDVVRKIADMYATNAAVMGVQPVNEPWQNTPIGPLQRFYWEGFKIIKRRAPGWKWFMHDSFRLNSGLWHHFMRGCPGIYLDTHIYTAWNRPDAPEAFYGNACGQKHTIAEYEDQIMPVVVGEWSLATDNCAMWLNGFNDNLPGFPMVQCDLVPCPEPYMGREQPGAPPPRWFNQRGPMSTTGTSTPAFGMCPIDKSWPNDTEVMTALGHKKLNAWTYGHGWFFWNFKTELEPKWDYLKSVANGWLPKDAQGNHKEVYEACNKENTGHIACVARSDASRDTILDAVDWACEHADPPIPACSDPVRKITEASSIFNTSWHHQRLMGGTCDFNGAAELADMDKITPVVLSLNTTAEQLHPEMPEEFVGEKPLLLARHIQHKLKGYPQTALMSFVCVATVLAVGLVVSGARRVGGAWRRARAGEYVEQGTVEQELRDRLYRVEELALD